MDLPADLRQTLHDVHDDAGPWLAALPALLRGLETRWALRLSGLAPELSYHLVLYAEREDGAPCVLKLSPPSSELAREADALEYYAGDGVCRLLARDDGVGALLLERVLPGISLQETWTLERDHEHTRAAAELMARLWRPVEPDAPFRSLPHWARALERPSGAVPDGLRAGVGALLSSLEPDGERVLLHADLHHGNILSEGKSDEPRYRAIDPKGVVGARGYEVGPYLLNPLAARAETLLALLPRRLAAFAEVLGLEPQHLARWGLVHAVLSACWSAEEHGEKDLRSLEFAAGLAAYLRARS